MLYCPATKSECKEPCIGSVCIRIEHDFSTPMILSRNARDKLRRERAYRNRVNLLALRLLERYDKLHSANCNNARGYRLTLLKRLEYVLPLSTRKERVTNGHLIIPEE